MCTREDLLNITGSVVHMAEYYYDKIYTTMKTKIFQIRCQVLIIVSEWHLVRNIARSVTMARAHDLLHGYDGASLIGGQLLGGSSADRGCLLSRRSARGRQSCPLHRVWCRQVYYRYQIHQSSLFFVRETQLRAGTRAMCVVIF